MPTKKRKITFVASDELASALEEFVEVTGSTLSSAVNELLMPSVPMLREISSTLRGIKKGNLNPAVSFLEELRDLYSDSGDAFDEAISDVKEHINLKDKSND